MEAARVIEPSPVANVAPRVRTLVYPQRLVSLSRSIRPHLPTVLVALGIMLAVLSVRDSHGHRHAGRFDPKGFEALFEADHADVVARASAYLRETDGLQWPSVGALDPNTAMRGVSQILDRPTLKALAKDHTREEIEAFADAGAPLVAWRVAYFRPFEYARDTEAVRVTVDRTGRVTAADRGNYKPAGTRDLPSEAWVSQARIDAAAALRIDAERLQPLDKDALPPGARRLGYSDGLWRVDGLELGGFSVVVGAWTYGSSIGFQTRVLELRGPGDEAPTSWGSEAWVAAVLTVVMAMMLGAWTRDPDPPPTNPDALLVPGFALGVAMALGQIGLMLTSRHGYHPGVMGVFIVVAIVLGTAGLVFARARRRGDLEPPSPGIAIALVALAVAAFIASCWLCGGPFARGCCERCGILRCTAAPLIIAALVLARTRPRFAGDAMVLSVVMLTPHCICDNLVNHHWMAAIGTSPMCFFLFYGTTLTALAGLRGVFSKLTLTLGVLALVVTGVLAYTHHTYHFPW